jgi:aspartyl-tRNA(Asn)/glutamyl-tRNA(Gln) amidotransferase subunit C
LHGLKEIFFLKDYFMSIQSEDVLKIAHLARLGVVEGEVSSYASELSNIMGLIEQMQEVETTGIEPMAHPLDQAQRLRPDEATEVNQRQSLQANAPDVEDGLFLVPRVLD